MTTTAAKMKRRKAKIREASLADYARIASLQSKYGLMDSERTWAHLWVDNPALRNLKGWPIGWVLESDPEQEIVGYMGNIPLGYEFKGKLLTASAGRAWVVEPEYRAYSLLLLNEFLCQKMAHLGLSTTTNPNAAPSIQALGLRVPVGSWDQALFWITNHQGFLASVFSKQGIPGGRLFSHALSAVSRSVDAVRTAVLRRRYEDAPVEICNGFDDRFDRFWNEQRSSSPYLIASRTREILEWHFRQALAENRVWILVVGDKTRIQAYSIFIRHDISKFALTRMMLVDFQSLDGNSLLLPMVMRALKRCSAERVSILEVLGFCGAKRETMLKLAPHRRRLSSWQYFYKAFDKDLAVTLNSPNCWDPCMFDGDSTL